MSEENVAVVQRIYEAYNAGGTEAARGFFTEDVVMKEPPEQPVATKHYGRDAVSGKLPRTQASPSAS
jgi:hypothetical protein